MLANPLHMPSLQLAGLEKRPYLVQALAHARGQGANLGRGLVQVRNHDGHEATGRACPHADVSRSNLASIRLARQVVARTGTWRRVYIVPLIGKA